MRSLAALALAAICLPALAVPASARPSVPDPLRHPPGSMVVTPEGVSYPGFAGGYTPWEWGDCTTDERQVHPQCVSVTGRVVDEDGTGLPGFEVIAYVREDGYVSKPGWNPEDEDTARPDFGDPMVLGAKYPEDVPAYAKFSRSSTLTAADGTFVIHGLYAGEVAFIEAVPYGEDPARPTSYYRAAPNYDTDYPFPTSIAVNENAVAYTADAGLPDLVAVKRDVSRVTLDQSDQVAWTLTPDPEGADDTWTLKARYAFGLMAPIGPDSEYTIYEQVRDPNGRVIEPWTWIERGFRNSDWGYGFRWFPVQRVGPACGWVTDGDGTRAEVGDIQIRWVTSVGTAEVTIPVPRAACAAYGTQPMPDGATLAVAGQARVGAALHAVPTGWPSLSRFQYTWYAGTRRIGWAVGAKLRIPEGLAGKRITVRADVRSLGYDAGTATATTNRVRK